MLFSAILLAGRSRRPVDNFEVTAPPPPGSLRRLKITEGKKVVARAHSIETQKRGRLRRMEQPLVDIEHIPCNSAPGKIPHDPRLSLCAHRHERRARHRH